MNVFNQFFLVNKELWIVSINNIGLVRISIKYVEGKAVIKRQDEVGIEVDYLILDPIELLVELEASFSELHMAARIETKDVVAMIKKCLRKTVIHDLSSLGEVAYQNFSHQLVPHGPF